MATLEEAVAALKAAVAELEAADASTGAVDAVRGAVETVLLGEGWAAPVPVTVADAAPEASA